MSNYTDTINWNEYNVGGLWANKGGDSMSGTIELNGETVRIVVFKNKLKQKGERTPDFRIFAGMPDNRNSSKADDVTEDVDVSENNEEVPF